MHNALATNDTATWGGGQAMALAQRLGDSFAGLASTQLVPSAPIMWEAEPRASPETAQHLATLRQEQLVADLEKLEHMLTYDRPQYQSDLLGLVVPLLAMPTAQKDELETAGYSMLIWMHFCEVPRWALSIAIQRCTGVEVFRPMPATLRHYLPIQLKRAHARAWELQEALATKQRARQQPPPQESASQEREARLAALSDEERERFNALTKAGDFRAAAKVLARAPSPLPTDSPPSYTNGEAK